MDKCRASSATRDPLRCTIRDLALNYASGAGSIKGIINSKQVAQLQKDKIIVTGRLHLEEATIQDYTKGTFHTKVDWNLLQNKLALEGVL